MLPPPVRKQIEKSETASTISEERSAAARRLLEAAGVRLPPTPTLPDFPESKPGYYLVEVADGENPKVTLRKSAEEVLKRIQALDGEDVYAYAFYGVHIPVTRPPRALLLPDRTLLAGPERPEDMPLVLESDGYLAAAALRGEVIEDFVAMGPPSSAIPAGDEDVDFLEDEDLPSDDDLDGLDDGESKVS